MSDRFSSKVAVGAAIAAGTITAAGLTYWYANKLNNTPPTKWKRVGEVTDLNCFPIKSCAPVKRDEFDCSQLGLVKGNLRDRVFMIITPEGQFVTARAHPKIVLITPRIEGSILTLTAPEKPDIAIDFERLRLEAPSKAWVWQQQVNAIDCGESVAEWLSEYVLGQTIGLRLVFYPESGPTRAVRAHKRYTNLTDADAGALHDMTSYMLINQASMDELNTRLDHLVKPQQFRPNIVVKGPGAWEEDSWKWVRIGDVVTFRNVKPCTRCIFTNINPETAQRNPSREPLKTLKETRSIVPNDSPVMGAHLGLRIAGNIRVGDAVYIEDTN